MPLQVSGAVLARRRKRHAHLEVDCLPFEHSSFGGISHRNCRIRGFRILFHVCGCRIYMCWNQVAKVIGSHRLKSGNTQALFGVMNRVSVDFHGFFISTETPQLSPFQNLMFRHQICPQLLQPVASRWFSRRCGVLFLATAAVA